MVKNVIEFACSHNHGRSPLAEAFARTMLNARGITEYGITSSGTRANKIDAMLIGGAPFPDADLKFTLEQALKRGIVPSDSLILRSIASMETVDEQDMQQLQAHARRALRLFVDEEHAYRDEAFRQFSLGIPKSTHNQTVLRPDVLLWLGMGKSNTMFVNRIYGGVKIPVIDTLAGYATRSPGAEFKSGFGGSLQDYLEMAEVIRGYTHQAITRLVEERKA